MIYYGLIRKLYGFSGDGFIKEFIFAVIMAKKRRDSIMKMFDPPGTMRRELWENLAPSQFAFAKWRMKT